jgi:hypothetical protein
VRVKVKVTVTVVVRVTVREKVFEKYLPHVPFHLEHLSVNVYSDALESVFFRLLQIRH